MPFPQSDSPSCRASALSPFGSLLGFARAFPDVVCPSRILPFKATCMVVTFSPRCLCSFSRAGFGYFA